MAVSIFEKEALCREFPFADETVFAYDNGKPVNLADVQSVHVKRLDEAVLDSVPREYHWSGSCVGISDVERYDFVLADGTVIREAVAPSVESGSNYAHSETHYHSGETVLEAIYRHNVADTLAYVVFSASGYNVVEHYSTCDRCSIIYKLPKGITIQELIEKKKQAALEKVRAESAF